MGVSSRGQAQTILSRSAFSEGFHLEMSWLKMDPKNIRLMSVALDTFHQQMFPSNWLKANMDEKLVTLETSQCDMSPLNPLLLNILAMQVTLETSQLEISPLNVDCWNRLLMSVMLETSMKFKSQRGPFSAMTDSIRSLRCFESFAIIFSITISLGRHSTVKTYFFVRKKEWSLLINRKKLPLSRDNPPKPPENANFNEKVTSKRASRAPCVRLCPGT